LAFASKAPSLAVSPSAKTDGHENEQTEPCGKPATSVRVKACLEKKQPAAKSVLIYA
jgi:hypothetical protein